MGSCTCDAHPPLKIKLDNLFTSPNATVTASKSLSKFLCVMDGMNDGSGVGFMVAAGDWGNGGELGFECGSENGGASNSWEEQCSRRTSSGIEEYAEAYASPPRSRVLGGVRGGVKSVVLSR